MENRDLSCNLAIVGSGLAGFAAAVFAAERGIDTVQIGNTGALAYTTGYFDLFGQLDSGEKVDNPWDGLSRLRREQPEHPLSRQQDQDIADAFAQFTAFLGARGLSYQMSGNLNLRALTPAGTCKTTYALPATMAGGPQAMQQQVPCLIVDFTRLKGFSARQLVANLQPEWPQLRAARLDLPELPPGELYPEVVARSLESPVFRQAFAAALKELAGEIKVVGLPAVFGMYQPDRIHRQLEDLTGLSLFEIPTMPPSVPGIRLRELFEQTLPGLGVRFLPQQKIRTMTFTDEQVQLGLKDNFGPLTIRAKAVILATGRFLSGGLVAGRQAILEPLCQLPVYQPGEREEWYQERYLGRDGHLIHRAGIEVDEQFRPLARGGQAHDPRLFAAGILLAHQDWIRERAGAGIAISSAYKAVQAAERLLKSK